jgi:UPF0755 protein
MNWNFSQEALENINKKNPVISMFKIIIWIFIILIIIVYISYSNFKKKSLIEESKIITLKSWDTLENLWEILNLNKYFLKYYIKNEQKDFELLAWDFKIEKNSNIENIFESLKKPIIPDEVDITILEWWNIYDIDDYLNNKWFIEKNDYINYVTNKEKIEKLTEFFPFIEWLETLEWFLYPDTYKINSNNLKINNLVITQLENFEDKIYNKLLIDENWKQIFSNKEIEEIINLASIVEKEEKNINEKPTVAWILKKRLKEGWMIWADITVCYAHELTSEECKMVVSKYIDEINEYNTRTKIWLPKTPIWNPSYETINATINSKDSQYYFYLHNITTWQIYYWKNNAEHENNKRFMK